MNFSTQVSGFNLHAKLLITMSIELPVFVGGLAMARPYQTLSVLFCFAGQANLARFLLRRQDNLAVTTPAVGRLKHL